MGNAAKKLLKKRKTIHGCENHCCQCECIESISNWNSIQKASTQFFQWQFSEKHQHSLLAILKHYNLQTLIDIFINYLSYDEVETMQSSDTIYCHANIWKNHPIRLCKDWLISRSFYEHSLKITMLGAGASGKRSLNRVWFNGGKWQLEWDPTIEDYWRKNVQFTFDN
eukprot:171635_1